MALKLNVNKAAFDKLSADVQAEYIEDGDGYKLDVDGLEDTGALKRARDREKIRANNLDRELKELRADYEMISNDDDKRRHKDIDQLDKDWQKKNQEIQTKAEAEVAVFKNHIMNTAIDNEALKIANKISTSPNLIMPHLKARMSVEFENNVPVLKIKAADGKPSDMNPEALEKEFTANKEFSAIIRGNNASGGGAGSGQKQFLPNGGAGNQTTDKPVQLSSVSPHDMVAHINAIKEAQN